MKIFIDLDDTLAHTSPYIEKKFQYNHFLINENPLKKSFNLLLKDIKTWLFIRKNENFWKELPLGPHAWDILRHTKELNGEIYILSALAQPVYPLKNKCFELAAKSKKNWVTSHYPTILEQNIIICHAKEKHLQIKPGETSVLIDDSHRNIQRWKNAGGIAIHFDNHHPEQAFDKLDFLKINQNSNALVELFNQKYFFANK